MSSVECLREFVSERLSAAAEEIFSVFRKTIVQYEEEIDRQRRLLDIVLKPEVKLHRIEPPQQRVCKEEEEEEEEEGEEEEGEEGEEGEGEWVPADLQLWVQEKNSGPEQEQPEPPQIKEEQQEPPSSPEGEQLVLKQEEDHFMLTPFYGESDYSEGQTPYLDPDEILSADAVDLPGINPVEPEPSRDQRLIPQNSHKTESQDLRGFMLGDSGPSGDAEEGPQRWRHSGHIYNPDMPESLSHTQAGDKPFTRDAGGKAFESENNWQIHQIVHTGEKPYLCKTCGKRFGYMSVLKNHIRIHTGEKPYSCETCGRDFRLDSDLKVHMRTHTGEKPYCCQTCGTRFSYRSVLKAHIRIHTGEKPHLCNTCGKTFCHISALRKHQRMHAGEKPYLCETCGKSFCQISTLHSHTRIHTGEKPHLCKTCGKDFTSSTYLKVHMRIHTGEKPYLCKTCGKRFCHVSAFKRHLRIHDEMPYSC